jgi:hypothetical protein
MSPNYRKEDSRETDAAGAFFLNRLVWWLAGANGRLLADRTCAVDRMRFTASGLVVLLVTTIAAGSASLVLYTFVTGQALAPAVLGGLFWGVVILSLDRLILTNIVKKPDGSSNASLWAVILRVVLATVAALAISIPVELVVFQRSLDVQVQVDRQLEVTEQKARLDARYSDIPLLRQQHDQMLAQRRAAEVEASDAFNAAACEGAGTCGSMKLGAGVLHDEEIARFEQLKADAERIRRDDAPKLRDLETRLRALEQAREKELNGFDGLVDTSDDLLRRIRGLRHLEQDPKDGATVTATTWLIRLLSLLLELLPLTVKLSSPYGPYDASYRAEQDGEAGHWHATREKELDRAGVSVEQEHLLGIHLIDVTNAMIARAADAALNSAASKRAQRVLEADMIKRATAFARSNAAKMFKDIRMEQEVEAATKAARRKAAQRAARAAERTEEAANGFDEALRTAEGLRDPDDSIH